MRITLPEGYEPPETARPGEPFDTVATIVQNPDGSFDLVAIAGSEVGPAPEDPSSKITLPWED